MKYHAGDRRRAKEYEKAIAEWWKKNRVFERSIEQRGEGESYVFYDGPPFITGLPHYGTLLASIIKDAVPRYWTMRGKRVERRWGWDCHGLPAENFVEKQLEITDRRQIGAIPYGASAKEKAAILQRNPGAISLEDYIIKARESMVANSETWRGTIERIGRFVEFDHPYRTMDKEFMESVWWAFKQLYEKGKIYEGRKVLMYDTKFGTPVSKAEVTMDNDAYQTVTDPSAYVKFKLKQPIKSYLMGVDKTIEAELEQLNIKFVQQEGDYLVELAAEQVAAYEALVDKALQEEYWNEYIANGVVHFTFKEKGGNLRKVVWRRGDEEKELLALCEQFAGTKFTSVEKMITDNKFYADVFDELNTLDELYLLAWTTTPWTLPANKMIAVSSQLEYGIYAVDGQYLIVAKALAEKLWGEDAKVIKTLKGEALVGMEYEDLLGAATKRKVFAADFVGAEEGTGIVHIAPYGEDDYKLYLQHEDEAEFDDIIDENGYYLPEVQEKLHELGVRDTDEHGIEIWAANKIIAKVLEEKGIIYKIEYIRHEYPFNPRSKQRIMYRAFPSWFFDIQGSKEKMLEENEKVNWFPEHFKEGRFRKNIEAAPDWNLSRDRFWATPMPVWRGDKGTVKVVGSYAELFELSGIKLEDYHRPWIDSVEFDIDGEHFKRIDKVLDCWFESGSMPFAQMHYPFENKEKFERNYPADFIVEYVGQIRAWFYYLHAVNTALFGQNPYKNVIVTGTLAGNDGRKMSKSLGNYTDPNELMDKFSADSLRLLLLSSPVTAGEDFALLDKDVSDTARKLSGIWNVYDFFTTYAEVDGFESEQASSADLARTGKNLLDRWIVSRLHQLEGEVRDGMAEYNLPKAVAGILPFIDDLSNWFVRRSRRRFWKSEDDGDKQEAYQTLYLVLTEFAKTVAPFTPFLAEELYQKMSGSGESVHLLEFPQETEVDEEVLEKMAQTREAISEGLRLRMNREGGEEQVKVRQPLAKFVYKGEKLPEFYEEIIKDELNVKMVENGSEYALDKQLTPELKEEGLARELIRAVQNARKKAGLNVDDRIRLRVSGWDLQEKWWELMKREVLASELGAEGNFAYDEVVKVEGVEGVISLEKV